MTTGGVGAINCHGEFRPRRQLVNRNTGMKTASVIPEGGFGVPPPPLLGGISKLKWRVIFFCGARHRDKK